MTVKIANLQYTNEKGVELNIMLAYGGITERWRSNNNYIVFEAFASGEEYARGRDYILDIFHMPISHDEVAEIFSQSGNVGEEISNTVWEKALTRPFIPDYSDIDEESNQRIKTLKSLEDLNAAVLDVPMG